MRYRSRSRFRRAPAGELLETRSIPDHQPRTAVVDQLAIPQRLSNTGHAGAMDAKHACHVFVRHFEPIPATSLMKRQQPAAKPLFDGVESIAHDPLRELLDLTVYVCMENVLKSDVGGHFPLENLAVDDERRSCDTNLGAVGSTTRIKSRCDPDRTFVTRDPYFDRSTVLEDLEFGNDRRFRKINEIDDVVLLVQILVLDERDALYEGFQAIEMFPVDRLQHCVEPRSE